MCGRYASFLPPEALARLFRTVNPVPNIAPSWNLAPSQDSLAVRWHPQRAERHLDVLRWGLLPYFTADPKRARKPINARGETVASAPLFREAFAARRCLVPAAAFYEWKQVPGAPKQPYAIARADDAPMAFGGLWERWRGPDGQVVRSFAIVTTAANPDIAELHDRMPLIVEPDDWPAWLGEVEADASALLHPSAAGTLRAWPVGPAVNRADNNSPDLLQPVQPEPASDPSRTLL